MKKSRRGGSRLGDGPGDPVFDEPSAGLDPIISQVSIIDSGTQSAPAA